MKPFFKESELLYYSQLAKIVGAPGDERGGEGGIEKDQKKILKINKRSIIYQTFDPQNIKWTSTEDPQDINFLMFDSNIK